MPAVYVFLLPRIIPIESYSFNLFLNIGQTDNRLCYLLTLSLPQTQIIMAFANSIDPDETAQ